MAVPRDRQLALLPIDLRREVRTALPMLDTEQTLALVDMIAEPSLGAA